METDLPRPASAQRMRSEDVSSDSISIRNIDCSLATEDVTFPDWMPPSRVYAIRELMDTERAYLGDLQAILFGYMRSLSDQVSDCDCSVFLFCLIIVISLLLF